jgi:hypothetical protein
LYNLLIDSAKTTIGTHKYKPRPNTCNKKPNGDKPWFNYECKVARQNYHKLKWKLKIKPNRSVQTRCRWSRETIQKDACQK